jgi:F-box and WD-40 domain protein 1/11
LAAKCDYRRIVSTSQDGRILMIDFGRDAAGHVMPGVELLKGVRPLSL